MKKDILFYSNHCEYSKQILRKISNSSIDREITYVSVDDPNVQLPSFIEA